MKLDPVLSEIRKAREEYALSFKGDVTAMLSDIRKRQRDRGRTVVAREPKRIVAEAKDGK